MICSYYYLKVVLDFFLRPVFLPSFLCSLLLWFDDCLNVVFELLFICVCVNLLYFFVFCLHLQWDFDIYMYKIVLKLLVSSFHMPFQYPAFVLSSSYICWFRYPICLWMMSYLYYMFAFNSESSHLLKSWFGGAEFS